MGNGVIKILIVEDDKKLCRLITEFLKEQGFITQYCHHGDEALYLNGQDNFHLILLDINLPGLNGVDVCLQLKQSAYSPKIILLTTRLSDSDQIHGLNCGADDYIKKPVNPHVLLARINALCRRDRLATTHNERLEFGQIIIDKANYCITLKGDSIDLSDKEFSMLWLLAINAGNVLSRDFISYQLRGIEFDGVDRTIDITISQLRKKICSLPECSKGIKTIRGKGYLFSADGWPA